MKHFLAYAALGLVGLSVAVAATPGDQIVDIRTTAVQCNTTATALPGSPM